MDLTELVPIPGPVTARIQAVAAMVVAFVAVGVDETASLMASLVAIAIGWQALRGLSLHDCRSPWRYASWTAVMLGGLGVAAGLGAFLLG